MGRTQKEGREMRIPNILKNAVRAVRPDIAYFEGWDAEEKEHTLRRLIRDE